ncbi:MAG: glutamine amidotransferase, partial [Marinoscillum sp.]
MIISALVLLRCQTTSPQDSRLNPDLPTVGLLMYTGVLTTEVTAPLDVFTKLSEDGLRLFNVVTIAEGSQAIVSEEGLTMVPDYNFENAPKLAVLFVPSAYDMDAQLKNRNIIEFIQRQNEH